MSTPKPFHSALPAKFRADMDPAWVLAFHRARFGDIRMEADPGSDGGDGVDGDKGEVGAHGFPEKTPIADMSAEQQAAYWKHQSRRHEDAAKARADYEAIKAERDQLRSATQTDAEKAVSEARAEERTKAEQETASKYQSRLVAAEVKAALAATHFPADKIAGQVEFLDHSKFLTTDGEVDADKVKQYADGLAPAGGGTWPDMGGGNRGTTGKPSGIASGRDLYDERHNKSKQST